MADTGAPWNIPYVAASDLVADWPTDNQTQAEAIADALSSVPVQQVVQTVKTDAFTTSSSSYTGVTGLSATITPASDTNKVLVIVQLTINWNPAGSNGTNWRLTGGNTSGYIGDAASNRERAVFGGQASTVQREDMAPYSIVYLDSPATTSATTYGVEVKTGLSAHVNTSYTDSDNANFSRGASSITLLEVAA